MEEVEDVDLCLVCCSELKNDKDKNNSSELLSKNMIIEFAEEGAYNILYNTP